MYALPLSCWRCALVPGAIAAKPAGGLGKRTPLITGRAAIDDRPMSKPDGDTDRQRPRRPVKTWREARLAQALRDNLKRRKTAGAPASVP